MRTTIALLGLILLFLPLSHAASILLNFTDPTPASGTTTANSSVLINVSVNSSPNLSEFDWNWNGTNYTIYNNSLVLMYNFDNLSALGENSSKVVDLSAYSNNGTVNGANWTPNGRYGGAYVFDGNTSYIDSGDSSSLQITGALTLAAWVNYSTANTFYPRIISKLTGYPNYIGYELLIDTAGHPELQMANGGLTIYGVSSNQTLTPGVWEYVAATYDPSSGEADFYVNGVLSGNSTGIPSSAIGSSPDDVNIGQWPGDPGSNFAGEIDEPRIYNRTLSTAEIEQQYLSNLNKFSSNQWEFLTNQSGLSAGQYSYYACANDSSTGENCTETRLLNITPVVTCPVISSPGFYQLNQSGIGAPNPSNLFSGWKACIEIQSPNVTFDCNGYQITGDGSTNTTGIEINSSATNVTVQNCPLISDYYYGIADAGQDDEISNVTAFNSSEDGFFIQTGINDTLTEDNSLNSSYDGFFLIGGISDNLTQDYATESFQNNFELSSETNDTLSGNLANGTLNFDGFHLADCVNTTLIGNIANQSHYDNYAFLFEKNDSMQGNLAQGSSTGTGFDFAFGTYNQLIGNNATGNALFGYELFDEKFASLENNSASSESYGFFLTSGGSGNQLTGNNPSGTGYGFYVTGETNDTLTSNTVVGASNGYYMFSNQNLTLFQDNASGDTGGFNVQGDSGDNLTECIASGNAFGIEVTATNTTFSSNQLIGNTEGYYSISSVNNTLIGNSAFNNSDMGFFFDGDTNDNITGNYAFNSTNTGFKLNYDLGSQYLALDNSSSNQQGFILLNETNDTVLDDIAENNGLWGFNLDYNIGENLTADNSSFNGASGFVSTSDINDSFSGDYAYANIGDGFTLQQYTSAAFSDNLIIGNAMHGMSLSRSNATLSNDYFSNNTPDFMITEDLGLVPITLNLSNEIFDNPNGGFQNYTNLSINDTLLSDGYSISWNSGPTTFPIGERSFANKFVNISINNGAPALQQTVWSWSPSELNASDNESTFSLYEYNASGWFLLNGTPDASAHTLSAYGLTPHSTYAILEAAPIACGIITSPGDYNLSQNAMGEPVSSDILPGGFACIKIGAPNVTFDCNGFNITGNGSSNTVGIEINSSSTNVTVQNCPFVSNYDYGVANAGNNDAVTNTTSSDNLDFGLYSASGSGNSFSNDNASYNNNSGFYIQSETYDLLSNDSAISDNMAGNGFAGGFYLNGGASDNLTGDQAFNNTRSGFLLISSSGYYLTGDQASNSSVAGFFLQAASDDTVFNNSAFNNSNNGFILSGSGNNLTENQALYNQGADGFDLSSTSSNLIDNNTAFNNGEGIQELFGSNNTIINNQAANDQLGIDIENGNLDNATGNQVSNGSIWGFFLASEYNVSLSNNTADFNARGYQIVSSGGINLSNNLAFNNSEGFLLSGDVNDTLSGNSAWNSSDTGYSLDADSGDNVAGNSATGCANTGFAFQQGVNSWVIALDNSSNNGQGFQFTTDVNDSIVEDVAYNNSGVGFSFNQNSGENVTQINSSSNSGPGVSLTSDKNDSFSNGDLKGDGAYGFEDFQGLNNSVFNFTTENDSGVGFILDVNSLDELSNDTSDGNTQDGFDLLESFQNTVTNVSAEGDVYGFSMVESNYNIINSSVFQNDNTGFYLTDSSFNNISYLTSQNSQQDGFYLQDALLPGSDNNNLSYNLAYNNSADGFYLFSFPDNLLYNDTAFQNKGTGFNSSVSNNVSFESDNSTGNSVDGIHLLGDSGDIVDNLTLFGNNGNGAGINQSGSVLLEDSAISGNGMYAISLNGTTGSNLTSNSIFDNTNGVMLDSSSGNIVTMNNISNISLDGLDAFSSNSNLISDNIAYNDSEFCYYLLSSANDSFMGNIGNMSGNKCLLLFNSNNSLIENNRMENAGQHGFSIWGGSSFDSLINNTALDNLRNGFFDDGDSAFNSFINNTAFNNSVYGFAADNLPSQLNTSLYFYGNNATNNGALINRDGYLFFETGNDTILSNIAQGNSGYGFTSWLSVGELFANDTSSNNSFDGWQMLLSENNNLSSVTDCNNLLNGMTINASNNTIVQDSVVCNNSNIGILDFDSNGTELLNPHFYRGNPDFQVSGSGDSINISGAIFDNASGNYQNYTNLSIVDKIESSGYSIRYSTQPAALPSYYESFAGKYVNISNLGGESIDSISWSWLPTELSGYTSSAIELWDYNGTNWTALNSSSNSNTLSLTGLSNFSTFALFDNLSVIPPPPSSGGNPPPIPPPPTTSNQSQNQTPPALGISYNAICPQNNLKVIVTIGEQPVAGSAISLYGNNSASGQAVTGSDGSALFSVNSSGQYSVNASSAYGTISISFPYLLCPRCTTNNDCSADQQCTSGICSTISCNVTVINHQCGCNSDSDCGQNLSCVNHSCVPLGCTNNAQCPLDMQCISGNCSGISCSCGIIGNHSCTTFQCCTDSQCPAGQKCISNTCQAAACSNCTGSCVNGNCIIPPSSGGRKTQCVDNFECLPSQYCDRYGNCQNITGCGDITNHTLVPYQCGDGPECSSCPDGQQCLNHQCAPASNQTLVQKINSIMKNLYYQPGNDISFRKNIQTSPLIYLVPQEYVPIVATGLAVAFLAAFSNLIDYLFESVFLVFVGGKKKTDRSYHLWGFNLNHLAGLFLSPIVLGIALTWQYFGTVVDLRLIAINSFICFIAVSLHAVVHIILGRIFKFKTSYHLWIPGSVITLLSSYLGNTFAVPSFMVNRVPENAPTWKNGIANLTPVIFSSGTMLVFALLNKQSPSIFLQLLYTTSAMYAIAEVLPIPNMDGKDIMDWNVLVWIFTFLIVLGAYFYVLFLI